ncbi:MAG TPA: alginate lyase family protein [Gemmatimonadaceae bacterium]|nr:alginate lyase family protein [Gemmatimonadaceae bacterium]
MRRGVRLPEDPAQHRRTVSTLPAELRVRGAQALSTFRERVGLALGSGSRTAVHTPRGLTRELRADPSRVAEVARRRLAEGVLPGLRDVRKTVALLRRARPEAESSTRCRADRAVDGVFDLLGHERVAFGNPIDWHRDPSSGTRAPLRHWSRIAYLDPATVGDYKLLWEVNRHQHFVTLGQAYAYSRDTRYARAFASQLAGWIAANPPRLGVNWASSLEVSYRAISWVWALQLFADAAELTDELLLTALESLRVHAAHIERYLSTYYSPNTHLTGEALGLLYLGTTLPSFAAATRWRSKGWDILREQLFRQVRSDGTYFEQALYYHRYTADIFHHALLLSDANDWTRDAAVRERVEKLDEFLVHAVHPDGTVPLVGDDDGGRLMRLDGLPARDARPTLSTGAAMFGRGDLRCLGGDAVEECLWLLGETGASALAATQPKAPAARSRGFRDGGFYVMRDGWERGATWALVDGGPHGWLNCGHAHADALALEIATGGRPVLEDSGTFRYTGAERDEFRATSSHNTATVDGESSSVTAGQFHWRHIARTTVHDWRTSPGVDFWRGSHDGYARLSDPAIHERSILFLHGRYLVVMDAIAALGAHEWTLHWHVAPGLMLRERGPSSVQIVDPARTEGTVLDVVVLGAGTLQCGTSWRSETYGARREAISLAYSSQGKGRQTAVSLLVPTAGQVRQRTPGPGFQAADIVGAQFRDLVVRRGTSATIEVADLTTDAECAVVTGGANGGHQSLYLLGGSFVEGRGLERQTIVPGALFAAHHELGRWTSRPIPDRSSE